MMHATIHHQRPHRGLQALGHARQDQRRRAGARRVGGLGDRAALGMGEVVGQPQGDDGENDAERGAPGEAPVGRAGFRVGEVEPVDDEKADDRGDRRSHVADIDRAHRIAHLARRHAHRHDAEDRGEHADRAQDEREDDELHRERAGHRAVQVGEILLAESVGREDDRRDQGDFVRLEHVGRHPGAIADVVADVVRDRRGVARIVLGDAGLDLADQVAADVGRLGVDAAAHAHEKRRQRAAEAEPDQHLHRVFLEDQEDDGRAEQAEADREHARDAAGLERDLHRVLEAGERGVGAAHVTLDREPHPDEAGAVGGADAHQEGDRDSERE